MKYHDLELAIRKDSEGKFWLNARCKEADCGDEEIYGLEELLAKRERLADMRNEVKKEELVQYGQDLYACLFGSGAAGRFFETCRSASGAEGGMRINLRMNQVPEVAALPWEFLHEPGPHGRFLARIAKTPIVRHLESLYMPRALEVRPPLQMLVAIPDGSGLNVEEEKNELDRVLNKLRQVYTCWDNTDS